MWQQFLEWIHLKHKINNKNSGRSFIEGEVFWCSIGQNVGGEVYGKGITFNRPVLVLKNLIEI